MPQGEGIMSKDKLPDDKETKDAPAEKEPKKMRALAGVKARQRYEGKAKASVPPIVTKDDVKDAPELSGSGTVRERSGFETTRTSSSESEEPSSGSQTSRISSDSEKSQTQLGKLELR